MTRPIAVMGIHGIGAFVAGQHPEVAARHYAEKWETRLEVGLRRAAKNSQPPAVTLSAAYYAHLLLPGGEQGDAAEPENLSPEELAILIALVHAHDAVPPGNPQGWPTWVPRQLLSALTGPFDTPTGRRIVRALCRFAREVSAYLDHSETRTAVRESVAEAIGRDRPDVVAAHSLGSIVAYETLWSRQDLNVEVLLTLGSPLGLPGAIFDRLEPPPSDGPGPRTGRKPPNVRTWRNAADVGDLVAVPRPLTIRFPEVESEIETVIARFGFHAFGDYLAAAAVAEAVQPEPSY